MKFCLRHTLPVSVLPANPGSEACREETAAHSYRFAAQQSEFQPKICRKILLAKILPPATHSISSPDKPVHASASRRRSMQRRGTPSQPKSRCARDCSRREDTNFQSCFELISFGTLCAGRTGASFYGRRIFRMSS